MLKRTELELNKLIKQAQKKPELLELSIQHAYDLGKSDKKDESRSGQQNKSLHVLFRQISDQCLEKGIEMRQLVRKDVPIQCTPENIKWLWKLLQEGLFKTKSTTELKRTGEIEVVYDNFCKILIERTQGELEMPPFPHNPENTY